VRLFITGAAGFVGSHVTRVASDRGHAVVGLVRSPRSAATLRRAAPGAEPIVGDLRRPEGWRNALKSADAVIHLAATKAGDVYDQFPGTVIATERLLAEMKRASVRRLVHISTFSVYDYAGPASEQVLAEDAPLVQRPLGLTAYTQTKLQQERLVREAAAAGLAATIIRPGAVWGGNELWDAGLGHVLGPLWLAVGDGVTRKFTYVENCAEAIVLAAERDEAIGQTLNIVDDDIPTQREYARMLKQHGIGAPTGLRVPLGFLRALVRALDRVNAKAFAGRARVPDMLNPISLDARFKRLVYPNTRAKAVLDWAPRYGVEEGLKRAIARRT
jgi:nucleoside-diphosphate-sugar epimerase